MATVWVGMSGGVDSSVAAARLVKAGHDVTGVTMRILPEGEHEGSCCSADAVRSAKRVCDHLGIPHYTFEMRDIFERSVIGPFVAEYAAGRTPNPCIECNDRLKFADLLARARTAGADALATGHYARIERDSSGAPWLTRGRDLTKDQSYFLYRLTPVQLEHVLFPVGDSAKEEIRAEAHRMGLPSAVRDESQEVCFVPSDAGAFVIDRDPDAGKQGEIVDERGVVIGTHRGIARYTIGQRKGLGLAGGPWYVRDLDAEANRVVVGQGAPTLVTQAELERVRWRDRAKDTVLAQVRYRATPVPASVAHTGAEEATVTFRSPTGPIAPGQAVVCYEDDRVVGGGVVEHTS